MRTQTQAFRHFKKIEDMHSYDILPYVEKLNNCKLLRYWPYEDMKGHDLRRNSYYYQFMYLGDKYCIEIYYKSIKL